jgi:poly-gamma-glutamate capsule biosynthesis protein CapA/YwtB (metallophosphatase superfamily)
MVKMPYVIRAISSFFIVLLIIPGGTVLPASAGECGAIVISAVGDIMMGTTWPEEVLPPRDGEGIFDDVLPDLGNADVLFGNLEGPLADNVTEGKCGKRMGHSRLCFEFRTPTRYVRHLEQAGFDALNVANNHAWDFGREGIENTVSTLLAAGIQPVGGEQVAVFEILGRTVAVAGFSYSPPSPYSHSILDLPDAAERIRSLKEAYDLVIVSFHGGAEGKSALRTPKTDEIFAGENRGNVVRFARTAVEAGADLVLGHGPHVPRALEVHEGKLIAYSLGNFLTYGRFNIREESGISLILTVRLDPETGDFLGGTIAPVILRDRGIPSPDPQKRSVDLIRDLSSRLNPRQSLVIGEDGSLSPLPGGALRSPSPPR